MAERPTPHSIAVCALIALHCEEHSPLYDNTDDESRLTVDAFLQDCLLRLNHQHLSGSSSHAWSNLHAPSLVQFLTDLGDAVGADIADKFTDWLTVAASSIDSLQDLIMSLQRDVQEGSVDAVSAAGVYIRQVCLGYDQLSFESVSLLWKDLKKEMDCRDTPDEFQPAWPLSPSQMEAALRQECLDFGMRRTGQDETFAAKEAEIQHVLEHNPELPFVHFLSFLNCVKHGERVSFSSQPL